MPPKLMSTSRTPRSGRMMRVSDTAYYRVIKKTDLTEQSLTDDMGLLYEENRDAVVSIALFNEGSSVSRSSRAARSMRTSVT